MEDLEKKQESVVNSAEAEAVANDENFGKNAMATLDKAIESEDTENAKKILEAIKEKSANDLNAKTLKNMLGVDDMEDIKDEKVAAVKEKMKEVGMSVAHIAKELAEKKGNPNTMENVLSEFVDKVSKYINPEGLAGPITNVIDTEKLNKAGEELKSTMEGVGEIGKKYAEFLLLNAYKSPKEVAKKIVKIAEKKSEELDAIGKDVIKFTLPNSLSEPLVNMIEEAGEAKKVAADEVNNILKKPVDYTVKVVKNSVEKAKPSYEKLKNILGIDAAKKVLENSFPGKKENDALMAMAEKTEETYKKVANSVANYIGEKLNFKK